jgi:hypothetical protein
VPDQVFLLRGTSAPPTSVELSGFEGQAEQESPVAWLLLALGAALLLVSLWSRRRMATG